MENTKKQYGVFLTNELVRMKEAAYNLAVMFGNSPSIPNKELKNSFTYYNAITAISLNMFERVKDSGVSDGPEHVLKNLIKTSQEEYTKLLNWYIGDEDQVYEDLMRESLEAAFTIYDYLRDLEEQLFSSIILMMDVGVSYEDGLGVFDVWNQRGKPLEGLEIKKPQESKKEQEDPDKDIPF